MRNIPIELNIVIRPLSPDETLSRILEERVAKLPGEAADGRWYALLDARLHVGTAQLEHPLIRRDEAKEIAVNLYADLGELGIASQGPRLSLLVEGDIDVAAPMNAESSQLASFIFADCTPDVLAAHLQALREVTLPDGSLALFRFQDIRVSAALMPLLNSAQAAALMGPASIWLSIDPCRTITALTLIGQPGRRAPLKLQEVQLKAVDRALLPHEILAQVNEADGSVLHGLGQCEQLKKVQALIGRGEAHGLGVPSDIALFCVLGMQLPEGFDSRPPFDGALEQARKKQKTFSQALDGVAPEDWQAWNDWLAGQDGMNGG